MTKLRGVWGSLSWAKRKSSLASWPGWIECITCSMNMSIRWSLLSDFKLGLLCCTRNKTSLSLSLQLSVLCQCQLKSSSIRISPSRASASTSPLLIQPKWKEYHHTSASIRFNVSTTNPTKMKRISRHTSASIRYQHLLYTASPMKEKKSISITATIRYFIWKEKASNKNQMKLKTNEQNRSDLLYEKEKVSK